MHAEFFNYLLLTDICELRMIAYVVRPLDGFLSIGLGAIDPVQGFDPSGARLSEVRLGAPGDVGVVDALVDALDG